MIRRWCCDSLMVSQSVHLSDEWEVACLEDGGMLARFNGRKCNCTGRGCPCGATVGIRPECLNCGIFLPHLQVNAVRKQGLSEKRIDSPTALGTQLARVAKEAGLILAIGCNLFLLLAMLSYDPRDPGWSHLGYQGETHNLTGVAGAWVADVAISVLGLAAFLLPFLVIWPALRFLRRRRAGLLDAIPFVMLRTSGALLLLLALATLASMHISNAGLAYPFTAGGLVGQALSDLSVAWLSLVGGSLVHWTLALFGLTLYVDLSWRTVLEACGGGLLRLWERGLAVLDSRRGSQTPADEAAAQPGGSVARTLAAEPDWAAAEATIRARTRPMPTTDPVQNRRQEPSLSLTGLSATSEPAPRPQPEPQAVPVLEPESAPPGSRRRNPWRLRRRPMR